MRYIFDTNHADKLMKAPVLFERRLASLDPGEAGLCRPSVGELWFMVFNSARQQANRARLERVLATFETVEFDAAAAMNYGHLRVEQRRKGQEIPAIDAQIAAIARSRSLTVLTADKHFDLVEDLTTENWLA